MKNILYILVIMFILGSETQVEGQPLATDGTILQIDSFPSSFVASRPVSIWLPPAYDKTRKYAVLYMHDGQMLFDSSANWNKQEWQADETISRLLRERKIRDVILVGVYNNGENRVSEYFPQTVLDSIPITIREPLIASWLHNTPQADLYLKFLVEELKPYIDRTYPTLPDLANTFIMGSSYGGLISLYAICEYPAVFGSAGCLSTHWSLLLPSFKDFKNSFDIPATFRTYLEFNLPSYTNHRIYFDHGTVGLDAFYKPHQILVDSIMARKGYTEKNWITLEFPGEDHSESAWAKRLHIPLEFLLEPR